MNAAKTPKKRGPASVDPVVDRVLEKHEDVRIPEKHEERHPTSIAELAYQLYDERGRQDGRALEDWIEAARRISDQHTSSKKVSGKQKSSEKVHA